jgi:hypothetical protein
MRIRRAVAKILLIGVFSALFPALVNFQSAWACSSPPNAPNIKAIWGASGGPTFAVTSSKLGEQATAILYSYALKKVGKNSFETFSDWVQNPITSQASTVSFLAPMAPENDLIAFAAYTSNDCGTSGIFQYNWKLFKSDQLSVSHLDIAQDIPLGVGTIPNYFFGPMAYETPQTMTSKNPAVCVFDGVSKLLKLVSAGKCEFTISQNNEFMQTPNPDVTHTINILPTPKILADTQKDRPDELPGYQIHVVYVKLKGVTPHEYLHTGDISNWLDLANIWMKQKLGKEFNFDTYQGTYDISTMASQYSVANLNIRPSGGEMNSGTGDVLGKLREEFNKQNGAKVLGKNLLFIIDANLSNSYCGFATTGDTSVITPVGEGCWSPEFGYLAQTMKLNGPSAAIAHELIHNLGVSHVCDGKSDLMIGEGCVFPEKNVETTLDPNHKFYVAASTHGANILDLKVWKDGSGVRHIQSDGVCYLGESCLVSNGYWTVAQGDLEIQEKIAGKWQTIQKFKLKKVGNKKFVANASIIPTMKGLHSYREYIAATKKFSPFIGKEFTKTILG